MKKLSKIDESIWSDIQKRSSGDVIRKEDMGKTIEIDGKKWILSYEFWSLGDMYEEENSDEWVCFAFNAPTDGTNRIVGDTEDTGVFGYDKWDIGETPYDIYVLRDYLNKPFEQLVNDAIENGNINSTGIAEIEITMIDYIELLYKKHMSDFAKYWIYELHNSDWSDDYVISVYTVVEDIPDYIYNEFDGHNIIEAHQIVFPEIDDWCDNFDKAITDVYLNLGWNKSSEYEIDQFSSPGNTRGICFIKISE